VETQIDHMLTKTKNSKDLHDVRSYRGANGDSDHFLVIAKCKIKKGALGTKKAKYKRWKLGEFEVEDVRRKYLNEIEQTLQEGNEENSIEEEWKSIKEGVVNAAAKTIGYESKKILKTWFDSECEQLIGDKKQARLKWLNKGKPEDRENYKEKRKQANKIFKKKKSEWIEKMMTEIEVENQRNNTRPLYNYLKGRKKKTSAVTIENEKWMTHFSDLYEGEIMTRGRDIVEEREEPTEELEKIPTYEEVTKCIKNLKNGKAAGSDQICGELLKYGGERVYERIYNLLKRVWEEEMMPAEWRLGMITPIPKQGDMSDCANYRGITLLNVTYKILTTILKERFTQHTKKVIGEYQFGFRKGNRP